MSPDFYFISDGLRRIVLICALPTCGTYIVSFNGYDAEKTQEVAKTLSRDTCTACIAIENELSFVF